MCNPVDKNKGKIFNSIMKYIIDEHYNLLPLNYFKQSLHNKIDYCKKDLSFFIKSARINVQNEIIDITDMCNFYMNSNYYITG